MKITSILGSPRQKGNTATVLNSIEKFITSDNEYIQRTIVTAVAIVGINTVNPCALFAKPFAAVPKATAIIKIV